MKCVFEASSGLEAHMIANLLEQEGIQARVDGELLLGAVGDLQTMGFVRVLVNDESYSQAKDIIKTFEAAQPADTNTASSIQGSSKTIIGITLFVGIMIGVLLSYLARF